MCRPASRRSLVMGSTPEATGAHSLGHNCSVFLDEKSQQPREMLR